jgi:predicted dehydrogenase
MMNMKNEEIEEMKNKNKNKQVRYAVVGLGYIAQSAVLPAFTHATKNSTLAALVSSDPQKLARLGDKYKVNTTGNYDDYEEILKSGAIDAVFVCTPNTLHKSFVQRAADRGVHVLCEKPLCASAIEARDLVKSCERSGTKLMTAYRMHTDISTKAILEIIESGKIGDLKYFQSAFSMQVREGNIRLKKELGGGPLLDLGIYCINAVRHFARSEPDSVLASASSSLDSRFQEVEETVVAILTFPGGFRASFTASFGAARENYFEIVGSTGKLRVDSAFDHKAKTTIALTTHDGDQVRTRTIASRDQFAPEILYFSNCILNNLPVQPSGEEGLRDLLVIEAIRRSFESGMTEKVEQITVTPPPLAVETEKAAKFPSLRHQELINAVSPSGA